MATRSLAPLRLFATGGCDEVRSSALELSTWGERGRLLSDEDATRESEPRRRCECGALA